MARQQVFPRWRIDQPRKFGFEKQLFGADEQGRETGPDLLKRYQP
jgi:hypothetical protein